MKFRDFFIFAGLAAGLIEGPDFDLIEKFQSLEGLSEIISNLDNPEINPDVPCLLIHLLVLELVECHEHL